MEISWKFRLEMSSESAPPSSTQQQSLRNSIFASLKKVGSALDSGVTTFLREVGAHVTVKCPKCEASLSAPLGAPVKCVGCDHEFTVDSAAQKFAGVATEAGELVGTGIKGLVKEVKGLGHTQEHANDQTAQQAGSPTVTRKPLKEERE